MTSLIGRLADKASIIKSSFSEIEKAVIKATRHNLKGPKEKHVRRLIVSTFEQPGKNHEIITLLAKRLELLDWIVVMKTLEVFHRLLRDGNSSFINDLKYKSSVFNLRNFKDISSPESHYQSVFVQKYSQYLEEKVLVFKMLSVELEKDPAATKSFTIEEAFEKVPRVQSQLNALLNCRASKNHINNPIIVYGFTLLLKDSFKLYRALNDAIINVLEHYFTMSKANATKALDIYKLFTKETDGIIQFFDITRKFSKTDLPELQHAPTTLVEALENYIRDLDEGRAAANNQGSGERGKKLAQQMDLFSFDDTKFNDAHKFVDESDSDDEKSHPSDFGHASQHQPTRQPSSSNQPSFDPFEAEPINSHDNLPTFSTQGTNANANLFDDPFGGPTQPSNPNQTQFSDKKKQIEHVMAQSTGMKPLQPNPSNPPANTGFGNNNQNLLGFGGPTNTGFGGPNNNFGQQNTGFGNQGFGQQNTGFGNQNPFGAQQNTGFGNQGFANPNSGFGQQNTGFGNQGFGQQNTGFGGPANTGFGNNMFGNPNNTGNMFGNPNNTGFGNNNAFNSGFNNNNNNNALVNTNNTGFGGNFNQQTSNPFNTTTTSPPKQQNNNDFNPFA